MPQDLGIYVDGRQVVIPGVVARTNVDAFNVARPPLVKRAAIIAESQGGPPQEFVRVTVSNAAALLKGGRGLELVDLAFDPSSDVAGVGEIEFYRVNAAVAATLAGTGIGSDLTVTAVDAHAGVYGNGIRIKRDAATGGGFILTVENETDAVREVSFALGPALEIEHVGTAALPTVEITEDAGGQRHLELTGDGASDTHDILIGGAGITTFADLAAFLNGTTAWTGTVLTDHHLYDPGDLPVGTVTLTTSVGTLDLGVQAQIRWLEGSSLVRGEATDPEPVTDDFTDAGFMYLSGGTEGAPVVTQDYTDALTALEERDVQAVMVGSTDAATQAAAEAHCVQMSHAAMRKERVFFGGPGLAADAATQLTNAAERARELQSELASIVATPLKRRNLRTGNIEDLSPNHVAAMLMGMACGVRPEVDLTFKTMKVTGTTWVYTPAQIGDAIKAGTVAVHFDHEDQVFRIADDVTTWQRDSNVMRRLRFGVSIRQYLTRKIRRYTKQFVGGVGSQSTVESILNATERALAEEVRGSGQPDGVLSGYDTITAVYDGATSLVAVRFNAAAVGRIGFIDHLATLQPTRIEATT